MAGKPGEGQRVKGQCEVADPDIVIAVNQQQVNDNPPQPERRNVAADLRFESCQEPAPLSMAATISRNACRPPTSRPTGGHRYFDQSAKTMKCSSRYH